MNWTNVNKHSGLPWWLSGKESICNAGDARDVGTIPGLGRSPGEGNDNPLQYSSQENPMDRGAWQAMVHGVVKSRTQLSTAITLLFLFGDLWLEIGPALLNVFLHTWFLSCFWVPLLSLQIPLIWEFGLVIKPCSVSLPQSWMIK